MKKSGLLFLLFTPFYLMCMMAPEEELGIWADQMGAERPWIDFVNLAGYEPAAIASALGVNAVPLIGRYSPDGYDFALTNLIVKLPKCQLAKFPGAIAEELMDYSDDELNLFFMILDDNYLLSGNPSRNLVFHAAAFPNAVATDNLQCESSMGLFQGQGVFSSSLCDTWKTEAIIIHPAGGNAAFSPNNAQFIIQEEETVSSFYTAAHLPGHRATAAYIIILHNPNSIEALIFAQAQSQPSLKDFLSFLMTSELREEICEKISSLFTYTE